MKYTAILLGAILAPIAVVACGGGESSSASTTDGSTDVTGSTSGGSGGSTSSGGSSAFPKDPTTGLRVSELGPVPPLPEWPDNPPTEAKKALGKAIYSDRRLSGSGNLACGNCHFTLGNFQSGGPFDLPDRSYPQITPTLPRHTPSLLNIVYATMLRWDGSYYKNLYETMVLPFAEANMNLTPGIPADEVEAVDVPLAQKTLYQKLTVQAPGYVKVYQDAFGQDITKLTPEEVWLLTGKALAVFIRVAVSRDSAFDKWNAGDDKAIGEDAIRGLVLFRGKGLCVACHSGPLLTDYQFHNVSTSPPGADGKRADEGRYKVTTKEEDRGAFLTPSLRGRADTSPYFHNASQTKFAGVIRHLTTDEGRKDPRHDPVLDSMVPLTDAETADLVAFLRTLRGAKLPAEDLQFPMTLP